MSIATGTPLWRNGPPEKPVLCNACGSRWRTKGTLANYTPLHARAETVDYEDQRVSRVKSVPLNKNKEVKLVKRKQKCRTMIMLHMEGSPLNIIKDSKRLWMKIQAIDQVRVGHL